MALYKNFPQSPHAILDPAIRWFPADEALRETSMEKLMPHLFAMRFNVHILFQSPTRSGGNKPFPVNFVPNT